ncbi:MAG: hypothetical protein ABIS47_01795 [Acidimicrobiales bacterium]
MLCAAVLALAGCGLLRAGVSTIKALDRAGFGVPDVQVDGGDSFRVTVKKDTEDLDGAAAEAAGVVWRELPFRIEHLQVTCRNGFGGRGIYVADRDELERRFGPRDPALDKGVQDSDVRTAVLVVLGLVVGGLLVLVGIIVLIVVLVRRSRRPPPPPPGWGTQPPPPGYGRPS